MEHDLRAKLMSFDWHGMKIPETCHEGLIRYVCHGTMPGDFLYAVLTNNLKESCARADVENQRALVAYVGFLYNHCPASCWGSEKIVNAWIDLKRKSR